MNIYSVEEVNRILGLWDDDHDRFDSFMAKLNFLSKSGDLVATYNLYRIYHYAYMFRDLDEHAAEIAYNRSIKYLNKAASNNFAPSFVSMGERYLYERNYNEAIKWFEKGANNGDVNAMNYLGSEYYEGIHIPTDKKRALKWFNKAAVTGDFFSMHYVGRIYEDMGDYNNSLPIFENLARNGDIMSLAHLGLLYRDGICGVQKDYTKAVECLHKAADEEDDDGLTGLASMYYMGCGVPVEKETTADLLYYPLKHKHPEAMYWYGRLMIDGHYASDLNDTIERDAKRSLGESYIRDSAKLGCRIAQEYIDNYMLF